jgi:enoyl-CoA hydratase
MADRLVPGMHAAVTATFGAREVAAFVALSGDDNPIHLDAAAASAAGFEREIVHGALVLGLISRLLGTTLPGPGTVIIEQQIRYRRPVFVGEPVTAHVEVTSVREDKPVVTLRTWAETSDVALDGETVVVVRALVPAPAAEPDAASPRR